MKKNSISDELVRTRGETFSFVEIGMMIEFDGKIGTIVGLHPFGNLIVKMANQLEDKGKTYCHPTYKMKYFDRNGNIIKSFE